MAKLTLGVVVAVLVALLGGWFWGASGRWALDRALASSELRSDLFAARNSVVSARVELYNVNFGNASKYLEDAHALLQRAGERLEGLDRQDELTHINRAAEEVRNAQKLAARLDPGANTAAAGSLKPIDEVLGAIPPRTARTQ